MNESSFLDGKRVLFLGYEYYDYHIHIRRALEKAGAILEYFSVMRYNPPWNLVYTTLRNTSAGLFMRYNRAYSRSILRRIRNRTYDYVFAVLGWQLPNEFYMELRKLNPKARFLNYHWDSVRKTVYGNTLLDIAPFFDRVYSFDRKDCEAHKNLHYLPLFYIEQYDRLRRESSEVPRDIDLLFIGSLCQYRRYYYVREIEKFCESQGIKFYHYVHVSKRFYVKNLLRGRWFSKVHTGTLSQEEIAQLYRRSRAILDLPHQTQTGLPMRVFEALGAGKKLITTNRYIAEESFYDPRNILIIDPDNLSIDPDFIKDMSFSWTSKLENYSISSWLRNIFT